MVHGCRGGAGLLQQTEVYYAMKQNCITGAGILGNLQSCCNQYFYMKYRPCESGHCDKPTEKCYARLQLSGMF